MGKSFSARKAQAFKEIQVYKASRRKDIIKCAAALALILTLVWGKLLLETTGIIAAGNIAAGAVMMMSSIGLAVFAGSASVDFTRCGHYLKDTCTRTGITKQDIADYERSNR